MSGFISINSDCLTINKREYRFQLQYDSSRIRQDKKIELDMKQEYSGRELYEMIQNADDEGSPKIELILTEDGYFHIKNWGNRPFSEKGLLSIMRAFLSPKNKETYKNATVKPIGNKGLGFRSLLNWSDEISIHSNGVECSFSKRIAEEEWKTIKNEGNILEEDIASFENEHPDGLPLPILSIPTFKKDNITKEGVFNTDGDCTTDIEVHCTNQSIVSDIEQKLKDLDGSVLLFLRNIKRIDIICKGVKRTLIKKDPEAKGSLQIITVSDDGSDIRFAVNKKQADDRSYEVGVAYPLSEITLKHVIYSYFPTRVRLDLHAIYHGTFELNASRNHLVDSDKNKIVLEKLGETAVQLASELVSENLLPPGKKWESFSILNLSRSDIESGMLTPLSDAIQKNIGASSIFPAVDSEFHTLESTLMIGKKLSSWLSKHSNHIDAGNRLSMHLIETDRDGLYDSIDVRPLSAHVMNIVRKKLDDIADDIEQVAAQEMSLDERAELIDAIIDCGKGERKLNILVDANGDIIDCSNGDNAYLLSINGNTVLPKCLQINAVDSDLVERLMKIWSVTIRPVTEKLQGVTLATYGDHAAVRRRIESWSSKDMTCEGMCEVLKWEFQNPTQESTSFSSDLYLFNQKNERQKACSLILEEPTLQKSILDKIDSKWILFNNLADWKEILGAEDEEAAKEFIYNILGVSRRVPCDHEFFGDKSEYLNKVRDKNNQGQIPNWHCNHFGPNNKESKKFNYSYVAIDDYLSAFNLTEALGLILTDKRLYESINNTTLYLMYNNVKTEEVSMSYATYKLRQNSLFQMLQKMVIQSSVFSCDIDYNYLENELGLDRITKINPLLVTLGAKTSIDDIPLNLLYELLANQGESIGIPKRYKELREAIRSKKEEDPVLTEIRDNTLKFVWARYKGELTWKPVNEVYYWDNDQLPQTILSTLPKLEIGTRVGEESVAKIFGVKLAKNIAISFNDSEENQSLSKDISKFLTERIKYFLAYRIRDDVRDKSLITQTVNALKSLISNLHIYKSSRYTVNGSSYQMKDGDILTSAGSSNDGIHYHICSSHPDRINAIADPMFCENLNEALCMALKVSNDSISNFFRNIITHDIRYIEFIKNKDITPETWTIVMKSLGVSEFEQQFWKTFSESKDIPFDISMLGEHALDSKDYIESIFPNIVLPAIYTGVENLSPFEKYSLIKSMGLENCAILGSEGLMPYYMDYFNALRNQSRERIISYFYGQTKESIDNDRLSALRSIEKYQKACSDYSEPFYNAEAEKIKLDIKSDEELESIFLELTEKSFRYPRDYNGPSIPDAILPEYVKILDELHLSEGTLNQTDSLIAKFPGLEELFKEQLKAYDESTSSSDNQGDDSDVHDLVPIEVANCHSVLIDSSSKLSGARKHRKSGYKSDKSKYRSGKQAELATLKALKASSEYEDVIGCSSILNKECGNDDLHYDISYRKKGTAKTDIRFLEVKSMSGDSVILSDLEYAFAKEHCENYDMAIYHDGKVSIIESPFCQKEGKETFAVQPDTYKLTLEWDD